MPRPVSGLCAGHANACFVPYTSTRTLAATSTSNLIWGPRQLQISGRLTFLRSDKNRSLTFAARDEVAYRAANVRERLVVSRIDFHQNESQIVVLGALSIQVFSALAIVEAISATGK